MVASDSFAEFLREQLAPLGRVTMRRMFGKIGMVTDDTLYFRVDDHNRAFFKEAESFPPLSYDKKGCTIRQLQRQLSLASYRGARPLLRYQRPNCPFLLAWETI